MAASHDNFSAPADVGRAAAASPRRDAAFGFVVACHRRRRQLMSPPRISAAVSAENEVYLSLPLRYAVES